MKPEIKAMLLSLCMGFVYVWCAGGILFFYIHAHPGELIPRSISVPIFCLFILVMVLGSVLVRRAAQKRTATETAEQAHTRRIRAAIGLKLGLGLWGLFLLNGILLTVLHKLPWQYAAPGLVVDILIIAACWMSLKRLKKAEDATAGPATGTLKAK
jgi:Na+/H+ antiporter NhaD/arsenite permease-like protein